MIYHIEKEVASGDVEMASPEVSRQSSRDSTKTTSPLTVSSGIMTKRGPIVEEVTALEQCLVYRLMNFSDKLAG